MSRFALFVRHDVIEHDNKEASSFFIVAQDINSGRRLALTTSVELATELSQHQEIRERQNRRILTIENHLNSGGSLNPEHWKEIEPAYGSQAWNVAEQAGLV